MANTLTYCSATKLAYRWGKRTRAAKTQRKPNIKHIVCVAAETLTALQESTGSFENESKRDQLWELTGEKLEHRRCHGNGGRDVGEFDDKSREKLDHDVWHLHCAHCKGHHTLFGAAINEASLETLH